MDIQLFKNLEIGHIPPTPSTLFANLPTPLADSILISKSLEFGYPFAFKQEQNGNLIQDIVPVQQLEDKQISNSSKAELDMHTETAFHRYIPSYVLLLCLRGDITAQTTYAQKDDVISLLSNDVKKVLKSDMFTTTIDASFQSSHHRNQKIRRQILSNDESILVFDSSAMQPLTDESGDALNKLKKAIDKSKKSMALKDGELLVINNQTVVHGRGSFQARYDGTDRWLKRCLVFSSIPPHQEIQGRVITTDLSAIVDYQTASVAQLDRATDF